jgi:hypothetical protein
MPCIVRGGKGVAAMNFRCSTVGEALGYARSLILAGNKGVRIQDDLGHLIEARNSKLVVRGESPFVMI